MNDKKYDLAHETHSLPHKQGEDHDKENVTWDKKPDFENHNFADGIPWFGTCSCGRRVYELYCPSEELYES